MCPTEAERGRLNAALLLALVAALAVLSVLVWLMPWDRDSSGADDPQPEARIDTVEKPARREGKEKPREKLERVSIAAPAGTQDPSFDRSLYSRVIVRVVDKNHKPVMGVRTGLMCESSRQRQALSLPTDERGECVLSISHEMLERRGIDLKEATGYVELLSYGSENPRHPVDFAAMPEKPLEFQIQDFARIDIVLPKVTRGFAPKPKLFLNALESDGKTIVRSGSGGAALTTSGDDGLVHAVPVAPGKEWSVMGFGGGRVLLKMRRFKGPRESGETVRVELVVEGNPSWLRGSFVNEEQERLVNHSLRAEITFQKKGGGTIRSSMSGSTNERGEFLLGLSLRDKMPGIPLRLQIKVVSPSYGSKDKRVYGALDIALGLGHKESKHKESKHKESKHKESKHKESKHKEPEAHDLGQLILPMLNVFLAGVILDDRGQPVRGKPTLRRVVTKPMSKIAYEVIPSPYYVQDKDGSFRFYGVPPEGRLALLTPALGREYVPFKPLMVDPGQKDIKIVLQRWGSLSLRLRLLSRGLGRSFFRVDLRKESSPAKRIPDPTSGPDDSLEFELLVPGLYSLRVFGASDPRPCVAISGLRVKSGEECKDPRLNPLDLISLWREVSIRVTLPDGKPAISGFVAIRSPKGDLVTGGFAIDNGVARILTMRRSLDLIVRVPGMLEGRLTNVASGGELQLEPGLERSIENPGAILPGYELVFAFRALASAGKTDDRIRIRHGTSGLLSMAPSLPAPGADRELVLDSKQPDLRLRFTAPGRYRIYGQLRRRRDGACTTLQEIVKEIEIASGRELTALPLGLTQERIQAALQELPPTR